MPGHESFQRGQVFVEAVIMEVNLKDGTDGVGNPECRQLRTIFDDFDLTEEIWRVMLEFLNGVFRF